MLSAQTIQTIKSTVPVLEQHGVAITRRFYELLFTNHPELLHVFNHANQRQGKQQQALANAVYAAALHIDRLEAILPAVKQIAHKHRSLGVKDIHYPIVGKFLLAAIKEVLGDAATDGILQAWAEAYGVIAGVFIEVEQSMYEQAEQQPGGWEGFKPFSVQRIVEESAVIKSFYLVPADGSAIASFEPGQYVSVKLNLPGDEYTHIRQYSLSDAPAAGYYRISVKREDAIAGRPAGKVSSYLHAAVKAGDVLQLSAPAGDFVLNREEQRPAVFISGGVGLTPMASMLSAAVRDNADYSATFIHAAMNGTVHAMKDAIDALAARHPQVNVYYCYEKPTEDDAAQQAFHHEGYLDAATLKRFIPSTEARFYVCGPQPFMKAVYQGLQQCGVSVDDIHYEFFGPAGSLEDKQEEQGEPVKSGV